MLSAGLEQERFTMMNQNSVKLTHRYDKYIYRKQKPFHYVIRKDAFLSKGTYNEEMESFFITVTPYNYTVIVYN